MRWLATLAVTASIITAGPASAAGTVEPAVEMSTQSLQFLALPPAPHQSQPFHLYTARAGVQPRTVWSVVVDAVGAVPKPAVKKPAVKKKTSTTTTVKPVVKKKIAPKTVQKPKPVTVVKTPAVTPVTPVASSSRVATVVNFALAQVGKRYVWGAAGPGSYDCSGLTMAAYAKAGIRLPHQSGGQAHAGRAVSRASLQRGDLIVYSGHVAIALGGGKMVHAANPRTGIVVANIYGSPIGYRRLL